MATIKLYKSETVDDTELNGGYEDTSKEIVSGIMYNLFPVVMPTEAENGITRYRKLFVHVTAGTTAVTHFVIHQRSTGQDYFRSCAGTAGQTQGGLLSGSPKWYGTGVLASNVSAGATSITVTFDGSCPDLESGDKLLITEKPLPTSPTENEEFAEISSVSTSGVTANITLTSGLSNGYNQGARVCHVLELDAIEPGWSNWQENSSSGTYDELGHPPIVYSWGTIDEDWTLTFYSSTGFTCTGSRVGTVGTGSISSDYSPANPAGGTYFTIEASGWGGTWSSGDTVTFSTSASSKAVWMKEVVPAGCPAMAVNSTMVAVYFA